MSCCVYVCSCWRLHSTTRNFASFLSAKTSSRSADLEAYVFLSFTFFGTEISSTGSSNEQIFKLWFLFFIIFSCLCSFFLQHFAPRGIVVSGVWVSGENWAQRVDNSDTCGTAHLWGVNNNNNTGVIWLADVRQVCICSPVRRVMIIIIQV